MIRKPRDRYIIKKGLPLPTDIDPFEVSFIGPSGEPSRLYSVDALPGLPNISRALLGAFYRKYAKLGPKTQKNNWQILRKFVTYLCDNIEHDDLRSLDQGVLREYLRSINDGSRGAKSVWIDFKGAEDLCCRAMRSHAQSITKVSNPVPGVGRSGGHIPHFAPSILIGIVAAAKKEARKTWEDWEAARATADRIAHNQSFSSVEQSFEDIPPATNTKSLQKSNRMIRRELFAANPILYPTADSLISFVVLIAYETAANADALRELQRTSVTEDVLFADRSFISWVKRRAGAEQRVSRDNRGYFSAPQLIDKVLQCTALLMQCASPIDRSRLFLVRDRRGDVVPLTGEAANTALRSMAKKHGVIEPQRSGRSISLSMMRSSVISEVYRQTGDLFVTMRFANHASPNTTVRYVIDRITDEMHDIAIATTQQRLSQRIRQVEDDIQQALGGSELGAMGLGMERDCANPQNGPSSRAGTTCPDWLWPLTDPGLVVPDDPRFVVHHVRMSRALNQIRLTMRPERFSRLYGDAYRIISREILPKLSSVTIDSATALADTMPAIELFDYE